VIDADFRIAEVDRAQVDHMMIVKEQIDHHAVADIVACTPPPLNRARHHLSRPARCPDSAVQVSLAEQQDWG